MLQQMWHIKEPLLLKATSVKHRSKFATLSPVPDSLKIAQAAINKHTKYLNILNLHGFV
jgi:hypothetical protein